jgi:hypothetical protein
MLERAAEMGSASRCSRWPRRTTRLLAAWRTRTQGDAAARELYAKGVCRRHSGGRID